VEDFGPLLLLKLIMNCRNCKHFSKYRNLDFGSCNNDAVFQYADNKEDLAGFNNDMLILMGRAVPVVGINYFCELFEDRKDKKVFIEEKKAKFATKGFKPPAASKTRRRGASSYTNPVPPNIETDFVATTVNINNPNGPRYYTFEDLFVKPFPPNQKIQ
jgi:hypothetical protein